MINAPGKWSLACHLDFGGTGAVSIIEHAKGATTVHPVPSAGPSGRPDGRRPVFLGVADDRGAWLMDPESRAVEVSASLPDDAQAFYAYPEHGARRWWYTNDGDEATGNDTLNCGDDGASMTVVEEGDHGRPVILKIICVGRGHHVPTFVAPDARHPSRARRVYISNLRDGTISVIGNDPQDTAGWLSVAGMINLCEPEREKDGRDGAPNNAFPHGKAYSPVTGRIYGLNNGYATVAVIDPATNRIETRIDFPGSSNLLLSPDGRYLIGKGADRKQDPAHVLGRLTVMDVVAGRIVTTLELKDIYPSTYRFNADGSRLYVTTAATGKGAQHDNLAIDKVLVYDAAALPKFELLREIEVGRADCGRRPIAFLVDRGATHRVFVPNPSDGTLTICDGADDRVLETVELSGKPVTELNFALLGAQGIYGC
jgi:hypothetical protein